MYTSRQAVFSLLNDAGAQDLATIILECKIHASDAPGEESVRRLLAGLLDCGDLFSDGTVFSSHPDEISKTNLLHCSAFLVKAFE